MNEPNVRLIVKISNPDVDPMYMEKIKECASNDHRISLIDQFVSRNDVDYLFQSVNAYISLHRAEGFGLTLGEAMHHLVPVITTAYSGNMDFCNTFNAYLVDYDLATVGEDRLRYKASDVWAQPRLESAVEAFRSVFNDIETANIKTQRAKNFVEQNFSINVIAEKIKKRVDVINRCALLDRSCGGLL